MKASEFMAKAIQAATSANLLLEASDFNGACDRSYYSMFNSARAVLLASGVAEADLPRTHNGLISIFSQTFVKTGRISVELGKALNRVEELRLVADYHLEAVGAEDAKWAVVQAHLFLTKMQETAQGFETRPEEKGQFSVGGNTGD